MTSAISRKSNWPHAKPINWRHSTHSAAGSPRNYVGLGIVVTAAPAEALLEATKALQPGADVRFAKILAAEEGRSRYRAEVALPEHLDGRHAIDIWRRIKQALHARFATDQADAVEIIDT